MSIDGDHSLRGTYTDLVNASACSHPEGFVIVDDVENQQWPEVGRAYDEWLRANIVSWAPVFKGHNKVVLCRTRFHAQVLTHLQRLPGFLGYFIDHRYDTRHDFWEQEGSIEDLRFVQ